MMSSDIAEQSLSDFWESRYLHKSDDALGWYEKVSEPSLSLIKACGLSKESLILDVGSGASVLVDNLLDEGYVNIVATDISEVALNKTKNRLSDTKKRVQFIVDDIIKPTGIHKLKDVELWHDRATFHFFTKRSDQKAYLKTLNAVLKPGGYVIISTFSLEGAEKCSGLPIQQYSPETLSTFLGSNYHLVTSTSHLYQTPWGEGRPFMYAVFKKTPKEDMKSKMEQVLKGIFSL